MWEKTIPIRGDSKSHFTEKKIDYLCYSSSKRADFLSIMKTKIKRILIKYHYWFKQKKLDFLTNRNKMYGEQEPLQQGDS
jgi:hypothetical protein